jgi:hypothetical protein
VIGVFFAMGTALAVSKQIEESFNIDDFAHQLKEIQRSPFYTGSA